MYGAPIYSLWLMCFDWRQGPDLYSLWYLSGTTQYIFVGCLWKLLLVVLLSWVKLD